MNFAAEQYLAVKLSMMAPDGGADSARYVAAVDALRQRVAAEPAIEGVACAVPTWRRCASNPTVALRSE